MRVLEPCSGSGRVAGEDVWGVGVFGDVYSKWGAMKDAAGAGEIFGGSGPGDDGQERFGIAVVVGATDLEDGGAEQREPPVFEIEPL